MLKKKNLFKLIIKILLIFVFKLSSIAHSEIILLSNCINKKDNFKKNEYILDLNKSLMTRNFIYDSKTYKKYKLTDINTKKENSITRFIYIEKNRILTDKIGYPQFYTQLVFEKNNLNIQIKTVINNETGISNLSKCKKIEIFEKES
jgi:hypothetical protein